MLLFQCSAYTAEDHSVVYVLNLRLFMLCKNTKICIISFYI
jgi:hypothetical protein